MSVRLDALAVRRHVERQPARRCSCLALAREFARRGYAPDRLRLAVARNVERGHLRRTPEGDGVEVPW